MAEEINEEPMFQTPAEFGHFILEKELGHGGMGGVYLGRDRMLDRPVAIKVMLKSLGDDAEFVARFQREAQAAARLNHPNIAQIYSFGTEQGMPYIAMELVSGGSLDKDMIEAPGKLDPVRVMRIGRQLAEALALAAQNGLVHGDVKPENVLYDAEGNAKLVDFGLAAMQGDTDEIWGTPYYISPEKVRKQKIDYRADIYSLGATLYHALTGIAPFEGADATAVVRARFEGAPRKPSEVRPELPPEIDAIIMRMLELEAVMRHPTYESLLGDFKRYLDKAGPEKKPTSTATRVRIKGRKKALVATSADDSGVANMEPVTIPEALEAEEEEKHGLSILAIAGLVAGGVVLLLLLVAGSLMWYLHSQKQQEERQFQEQIVQKQGEARAAIAKTTQAITDFGQNFHALVGKIDDQMDAATKIVKAELTPEILEAIGGNVVPPETKDIADAQAYVAEIEAAAAAVEKKPEVQPDEKKDEKKDEVQPDDKKDEKKDEVQPDDKKDEKKPEAKPGDKKDEKKPEAKPDDKKDEKKPEAKPDGKKDEKKPEAKPDDKKEEKKSEAKPDEKKPEAAAEEGAAEGAEPAKPEVEVPQAVKQYLELWADVYFCRASDIRVQARVKLLLKEAEKVKALTQEDAETTQLLGKLSQRLVEGLDAIKAMKCVEMTQRKANLVRTKSVSLSRSVQQQMKRIRDKAAKEAKAKADAAAKAEAEKKAAEELKALSEAEVKLVGEKAERLDELLKRLSWDLAIKQLDALKPDLKTQAGQEEYRSERAKIECMQGLQKHFVRKGKNFSFQLKGGTEQVTVAEVDAKSITFTKAQKVRGKWNPVNGKQKVDWDRFFGRKEHIAYMNQMLRGLVLKGPEATRIGPLEWSRHMLGAALMLEKLYGEVEGAAAAAPAFVKKAVKQFAPCRKNAAKWFPDVELPAADEE